MTTDMESIKEKYNKILPTLQADLKLAGPMAVPKLEKVIVHVGMGKVKEDKKRMEMIEDRLAKITGQKASPRAAKKSIATFKLREGQKVGAMVTLRGSRMYEFLDKLINVAIPRMRDFRGLSYEAIDNMGNFTFGIKESIIFPETGEEEIKDVFGLSVTVVTTAGNKEEAKALLDSLGFPFKK